MGKLQKKKNKSYTWLGITIGIAAVALIAVVININIFQSKEAGAKNTLSESQLTESQLTETEILTEDDSEEEETVQIVMIGDMLMHTRVIKSGLQEDGTYNFDHLFKNVKEFISAADLAIVNQEVLTGGESYGYTGYPSFNSPYALVDAEVAAGFDVILMASNHTLDKGKQAVLNCMDYMDTNYPDLAYVGINRSQDEQDNDIYIYEENGIKVAVLNYTYGTNGISLPSDAPYLVNLMDEDKIRADIQKAEEIADFTIVCPHWGTEYNLGTDSRQEYWTGVFLEEGVDLVLGAHPHCIEPIEWVTDENGNEMLVYYSLGNFVTGTSSSGDGVTNRMVGGIADVTIGKNEETGEVEVIEYGAVPIVCHISTGTDYTVYYMDDYTQELASLNLIVSQDSNFSKETCEAVFDQVWGEE